MNLLKQSTAYTRTFTMYQTDHVTAATGKTVTVNLSKAGAAFGAAGGTITEIANGWYKIVLSTTDTNTLGDLSFRCTASGCDDTNFVDQIYVRTVDDLTFPATSGRSMVVDANGLVDANAVKLGPTGSGTAQTARDIGASVLLSSGTGTGQLDFTSGVVKANTTQFAGQTVTAAAGVTLPSSVASPTNITAGTITTATNVTSVSANGIGATSISAAGLNAIADGVLDRNMATGTDSGTDSTAVRTARQALRASRNKASIAAGTLSILKEDDSTVSWTASVSTSAGNPISAIDPTD